MLYFWYGSSDRRRISFAELHGVTIFHTVFTPSCRQLRSGWNYRFRVCLWLSFWKGKTQLLRFSVVKQCKHVKTDQSGIWKVLIWEVGFRTFRFLWLLDESPFAICRCQMSIHNFSSYVIYCQRISSSRLGAEATPDLYLHNPEQGIGDLAGLGRGGTQGVSPTHCLRFVPSSCQLPVIKIYSNGNPRFLFATWTYTSVLPTKPRSSWTFTTGSWRHWVATFEGHHWSPWSVATPGNRSSCQHRELVDRLGGGSRLLVTHLSERKAFAT